MASLTDQLKNGFHYFIMSSATHKVLTAYDPEPENTDTVFGTTLDGGPNDIENECRVWVAHNIPSPDGQFQWQLESALTGTVLCFENEDTNLKLAKSDTTDFKQLWRLEHASGTDRDVNLINLGVSGFSINMTKVINMTKWGVPVYPIKTAEHAQDQQWKLIQLKLPESSADEGSE